VTIPDLLQQLLTAPAPSGSEERATAVWRAAAAPFAEVSGDTLGSSFARVAGRAGGPVCALVGHIDEIGVIATHVDEQGFVSIRKIGGFGAEPLVGQRLEFLSGVKGVVARRRDTSTPASDRKPADIKDLHVDLGARDGGEARALVRPGDAAVLSAEPAELPNGRIVSRSLDNRLGAYIVLEAARRAAEAGAPGDVVAIAAAQEEIGCHGARTAVFALEPDLALVFDVTAASDSPGADAKDDGEHALGSGPTILRGPLLHPHLVELLVETAEADGIPHTLEVAGGQTNTDADYTHISRGGVPTAVVSVPLRYMHSPSELAQLSDVEDAIRLATGFLQRLEPGMNFAR
jgi:putative aminopeptidase FrvX